MFVHAGIFVDPIVTAQVPFEKFWAGGLSALVLDDPNVLDPPPLDDPANPNDDPATLADNGPGYRLCQNDKP